MIKSNAQLLYAKKHLKISLICWAKTLYATAQKMTHLDDTITDGCA